MKKMKDYTVLVPMGGEEVGKIAHHSVKSSSLDEAAKWAKDRFNHSCVVVEMKSEIDILPLEGDIGNRNIYLVNNA
jgi:hypothetical protein